MSDILTHAEAGVLTLTLHRLEKKNSITAAMYAALADALAAAREDAALRAVVIQGHEQVFSAGNDLGDFLDAPPAGADAPVWRFLHAIAEFPKPLVAGVCGAAVGIGTTLLLHCDLVYAAPNARFQLPFVPLAIVPEFGSTFLLPRIAGYQRAAELLLLGQPFDAKKAHEVGIVTEVVPQERLLEHALQVANALAALPPESIRLTKRLLKARYAEPLAAAIEEETRLFTERLSSPEAKEAMSAFLEKRKPDFSRF